MSGPPMNCCSTASQRHAWISCVKPNTCSQVGMSFITDVEGHYLKYSPQLEEAFHRRKCAVWVSWRMDETYIKVKGQWYYLYHAVDKAGQTIDFLLTEQRDERAAKRFLT